MSPERYLLFGAQITLDLLIERHGKMKAADDPMLANCIATLSAGVRSMREHLNLEPIDFRAVTSDTLSTDALNKPSIKELFDPVFGKN